MPVSRSLTLPEQLPTGRGGGGVEVLDRLRVVTVDRAGEVAHPAVREDLPDRVVVRAAEVDEVGLQDRVPLVEDRRVRRRQLHRPGDEPFRHVRAERRAQVPQRLAPDLAVGVHLGDARWIWP